VFVLAFFVAGPIFFLWIAQFLRYGPGEIVNPGVLLFNLAVAIGFFLFFWISDTLEGGLKWMLLFLGIYDAQFIMNFFTFLIIGSNIGFVEWISTGLFGIGLILCLLAWARNWSVKRVVRTVIGVSVFSILVTVGLNISETGVLVGIGRALVTGLVGPIVALVGTTLRARGDWPFRENRTLWYLSKELDPEDWTRSDVIVIEDDIDSFNKTSREAVVHVCRFASGGRCEDDTLKVSDSLGGLIWDEIEDFDGKQAYLAVRNGEIIAISFYGIPKSDPQLHQVIERLCTKLDVRNVSTDLFFQKRQRVPVSLLSGYQALRYWLRLDQRLSDKLSPSEWEPLIMSTLIVHRQIRRKQILGLLQGILAPACMVFIWFPIFGLVADFSLLGPMLRITLFAAGFLSLVCLLATFRIARNIWRDADRLTGDSLGAKTYFDILSKLDRLVPSDGGMIPRVLRLFESNPTIEERTRWMSKTVSVIRN
jgi:hypothetical protein